MSNEMNPAWQPILFKPQFYSYSPLSIAKFFLTLTVLFYPLLTDCMATDAPLKPAGKRVITVAKDGGGDYTSIQAALDASRPGDTIQVKNGTYNGNIRITKSGTSSKPIALVNYPGHKPVIKPGDSKPLSKTSKKEKIKVEAEWIILDGFEITNGSIGVSIYKPHNTIRNNWIHHNADQGIFSTSGHLLIENNLIAWNGLHCIAGTKAKKTGVPSPRHCHGMYLNNNGSQTVSNLTVRRNVVWDHGGNGIMLKTTGGTGHTNNLVENNIIMNNSQNGISLFHKISKSVIRNNTIIITSIPSSNASETSLVSINDSIGNTFSNNIFYTTLDNVHCFRGKSSSSDQNTLNHNVWKVKSSKWQWKGKDRSDFKTKFKSLTKWDTDGQCCESDSDFAYTTEQGYHLNSGSPVTN